MNVKVHAAYTQELNNLPDAKQNACRQFVLVAQGFAMGMEEFNSVPRGKESHIFGWAYGRHYARFMLQKVPTLMAIRDAYIAWIANDASFVDADD